MIIKLCAILVLLFFSFLFSSSETAFFSLHPYKVVFLRSRKKSYLSHLLHSPRKLLIAILFANTMVNVTISGLSERILYHKLTFVWITLLTTYCLLIFGEYVPKIFAIKRKDRIIKRFSPILYGTYILLYPITVSLTWFLNLIDRESEKKKDYLEDMLEIGVKEGAIQEVEYKFSEAFITLSREKAKEIMRPRTELFFVRENERCKDVLKKVPTNVKRVPVYKKGIDNITGILELKNIFGERGEVRRFTRPPVFVNEETDVVELLRFFRQTGQKAVMVMDEYGGIAGMVDIEDIERMFLKSLGEKDPDVVKIGENEWLVDGSTPIYRINELVGTEIEGSDFTTISGFILYHIGRVPSEGETFSFRDMIITIEDVKGHRIEKLKLKKRDTV